MTILFLHGLHSVPGGDKPNYLAQHGHQVINPALHDDFQEALRVAQAEFDRHHPDVIVGSSRGGAVAMNIQSGNTPLVLLCPAWEKYGTAKTSKPGTVILHSRADDVVPFAASEELIRNSGLPASALVEVGTDHRLADPEPLAAMLKACENYHPIFCGIDISSDTSKCAVAIGHATLGAGDPTLAVTLRQPTDQGENDWNLATVAGLIAELSARCKSEHRKAIVAADIPFGYPRAFAPYLACHPLKTKHHTDQLPLVDDLVLRGCEKQLKRVLLSQVSWTTPTPRLPLWRHYQSLRTAFFSETDPKRVEPRNKDGSVRKSKCFPASSLGTVTDKIGRAIARWIRVACELGARSVGPSVWTVDGDVYLFECYPLASLVSSGLWHPDLKSGRRGRVTRAALIDLLRSQRIRLAGTDNEHANRYCGAAWGNVQVGDVTRSDHTLDALICTCTAWWCGSSVLSRCGVNGFGSYPKPPLAETSEQCFADPTGKALDEAEGGIYYPRTPECLLDR